MGIKFDFGSISSPTEHPLVFNLNTLAANINLMIERYEQQHADLKEMIQAHAKRIEELQEAMLAMLARKGKK